MKVHELKIRFDMHARPATFLVSSLAKVLSSVNIFRKDRSCNAKSILSLMSLGITAGDKIKIIVVGKDDKEALDILVTFFNTYEDVD